MISVNYSLEFNYRIYQDELFPVLTVEVRNPVNDESFSMADIQRNLLGRDFFDRIQVGFRESHSQFFIEPTG